MAGPAPPTAASLDAPHASASPSSDGHPDRRAHRTARSQRPEVVLDTAPRAAGLVTAGDAATALPRHPPAPSTPRRAVSDSFEIPAPEASAPAAAPNGLDRPAQGAGPQAGPTRVVLLAAGLCTAVLAAVGIAAVRPRRADGSSPETAGAPSLVPEASPACTPVAVSSKPSARPSTAASPRCASRGRPHRSRRRRTELVAAS
jgi:hypothetical protein